MECLLCEENENPKGLWIKKFKYWNIHACWYQPTLGTISIILKRHSESFLNLNKRELDELVKLIKVSQKALANSFKPDWYNIQQNGNWHHHLHFFVFPRYKKEREFAGIKFVDKTFGEPITYTNEKINEKIRKQLTDYLATHF